MNSQSIAKPMQTPEDPALRGRARRAIPLIAAALAVALVAGLIYLRPGPRLASTATPRPSPTQSVLAGNYSVDYKFISPSVGWALIYDPSAQSARYWVFGTTDGAVHWTQQLSGSAPYLNPGGLVILDRNHGFFYLGRDAAFQTSDGGHGWTWISLPPQTYGNVWFVDAVHWWYQGLTPKADPSQGLDTVFLATADGGVTWTPLPPPPAPELLVFRNRREAWSALEMVGNESLQPTVYSTHDGAQSWQAHVLPAGAADAAANQFSESGVELLPGGGVLALKGFTAYASFDGGDTWRELAPAPVGNTYTDMAFAAEDDWWAMHEGVLFESRDSGQSWREVALQFDSWEYRVQVLDSRHAWARLRQSGSRQTLSGLAFTVDGGLNWTNANVPRPG